MHLFLLILVSLSIACEKPAAHEPAQAPATVQPAPGAPAAAPPAAPASAAKAAPDAPESAGGLSWQAPAPFVARERKSSMRAAEYGLEGEPRAELAVFYFGPDQGGTVEANVTRWLKQFTQRDGSDTAAKSKREELKQGDLSITIVEATGDYAGGMGMPGTPAPAAIPDAMLLGAIASGPQGPVFFKLVGPATAVSAARDAFRGLLESLRATAATPGQ